MVHGFGGLGWLWIMVMVVVGYQWWVFVCCGFFGGGGFRSMVGLLWVWVFLFGFCGRWLFKEVLVVVGPIWGGFKMEVDRCFDIGWICNEVLVGYKVVIGIFGFRFYWYEFGWVLLPVVVTGFYGQRWLLGLVVDDGGGGFQYEMDLQWGWFGVLMWWWVFYVLKDLDIVGVDLAGFW